MAEDMKIEKIGMDQSGARVVLMGVPDVPGVAARVFSALAEASVSQEMIVQNNMRGGVTDIGFLVKKDRLDSAIDICRRVSVDIDAQGVSFSTEIARVSVCGQNLSEDPGIAARIFSVLARVGVNIEMIVSNSLYVTCVVPALSAEEALDALKREFLG